MTKRWHAPAATAVVGACAIASTWLTIESLQRTITFCALGGCSTTHDETLGHLLGWAALVMQIAGLVVGPRLVGASHKTMRAVFAIPTAVLAGVWSAYLLSFARWGENVALFVTIATVTAILVPPRNWKWSIGFVSGGLVAALFGDVPLPGLAIADGFLVLSTVGLAREADGYPAAAHAHHHATLSSTDM